MGGQLFCYCFLEVMILNITKFIKSHKDLDELPFLVVFRTILVLSDLGMLRVSVSEDEEDGVEVLQRKSER